MRLRYIAVVFVVIVAMGCGDAGSVPASDSEISPVSVVTTSSDETENGDGSELVLTVFEVCYSICSHLCHAEVRSVWRPLVGRD